MINGSQVRLISAYNSYSILIDPLWTRSETDELWSLLKQFDLRFIVVHDRFSNPEKSLEDLKDRYYAISRRLLELNADHDEDITKHPLNKVPFKYEQEVERKRQIEKLFARTEEEIEEEKKLIVEYKRIEAVNWHHDGSNC